MMRRICEIWGVPFDTGTQEEISRQVQLWLRTETCHVITTPNPEILLQARAHSWYRELLAKADMSLPDGTGLLWASTFLHRSYRHTLQIVLHALLDFAALVLNRRSLEQILVRIIPGSDTASKLIHMAAKEGYSIGFVGGEDHVRQTMLSKLMQKYPTLQCVASIGGNMMSDEDQDILASIAEVRPAIILLASSFPRQEQWMLTYKDALSQAGVRCIVGVGGTFDFLAGAKKRAPRIMRRLGLEWLFRVCIEPTRWKRIVRAVLLFPWQITRDRMTGYAPLFTLFPPLEDTKSK